MRARSLPPSASAAALGLLVAGVLATTAGCGPGFDPYNRLLTLRVLAIRSQPVAPATGEETTIDAKVYTPDGTAARYAWSWCPFSVTPGAPCPISESDLSALAGVPVSYDLGTAPTAKFSNDIPPAALEAVCAGQPGVPAPDCTDGFPIELKLTVRHGPMDETEEMVQAVRPLRLRFRTTDQANNNPTLDHLYAILNGTDAPVPLDFLATPVLPRHEKTVVGAVVQDGSESYMGKDDAGNPAQLMERLNLSWFVDNGDTDHQRTAFIDGQVTLDDASRIKWTPAFHKDYPFDVARLIVIIRDDREGAGWAEGLVRLKETP